MSTPLMRQYREVKEQVPGCVLFFRMGDFYELFEDDAVLAARILGITLTSRNNGSAGDVPLCGFPYHAAERYIPRMIQAGHRVAVCEQVEDPKLAKGIVKREVVEIITAGTALSENNLDAKAPNYLCGLLPANGMWALAALDVSTGRFFTLQASVQALESELYRLLPRELLLPEGVELSSGIREMVEGENLQLTYYAVRNFTRPVASSLLCTHFGIESLESLGLATDSQLICVAGATLAYARETKRSNLEHIVNLEVIHLGDYMVLDPATQRNLELIKPINSEDYSSTLFAVLDHTVTALGARRLRQWISHPLLTIPRILQRQEAIAMLVEEPALLEQLKLVLREIQDMERLLGRIGSGRANARDIRGIACSCLRAAEAGDLVRALPVPMFVLIVQHLDAVRGRGEVILQQLCENLPLTVREGGMICPGANAELDALNHSIAHSREWLAGLEARERERLAISSLKVGFNKVFGYYIEITHQHQSKVPSDYIRKQTLANCERYITPEMKECETLILGAEARIHEQEYRVFCALRDEVNSWRIEIQAAADAVADLDTLTSLAVTARRRNYARPVVDNSEILEICEGRHPVISAVNPDLNFVPNDLHLQNNSVRFMLITGPNMAGKSTYLRQCGLIVLLAQMGSFVPARSAHIGVVDRIFTRVGASDRLARGQSTFMVEMVETAAILRNATPRSLVLLDEIGRGTSTFDGLSIAWAVAETLHSDPLRSAKTLFATHYHEMTGLVDSLEHAQNYQVAVREEGGKLLFLRKIIAGACDSSYGIHVAEMAGLPAEVLRRARRILLRLEKHQIDPSDDKRREQERGKVQQDLFSPPSEELRLLMQELRALRIEEMTPLQALSLLSQWKTQYAN